MASTIRVDSNEVGEVWQAARGEKWGTRNRNLLVESAVPRPEEARSCSCVHASAWAPAVQQAQCFGQGLSLASRGHGPHCQALQRISTRPGYRYVSQMGISPLAALVTRRRTRRVNVHGAIFA